MSSERFWVKVREVGECWEWFGARTHDGYGKLKSGQRYFAAHRWAYEEMVGPIPTGLDIDHLCRNRACVNPDHLEPVTRRENTLRGNGPGGMNARKTECVNGHDFTPENTYINHKGGRSCRACNNLAHRHRRAARKRAA